MKANSASCARMVFFRRCVLQPIARQAFAWPMVTETGFEGITQVITTVECVSLDHVLEYISEFPDYNREFFFSAHSTEV